MENGSDLTKNLFLSTAREGKNAFWRYLTGVLLIILPNLIATIILIVIAFISEGTVELNQWSSEMFLVVAGLPFGFSILGLWFVMRVIHHRPFVSLVNPKGKVSAKDIGISALVWLILCGLSDLFLGLLQTGNLIWTFDARRFFPYMILAIILIPIQILAEELIFRGYITQAFGLLSKKIWIPFVIPSVLFGLLHGANPEVTSYQFVPVMAYYIGMGLFLGWMTLKYQRAEFAIGVHLATNLYASLITTFPNSTLPSPALFTYQKYDEIATLAAFVVMVFVYAIFARFNFKSYV